jgi:hypothetical protein
VPVLLPGDKPAADRPVEVVVDGGALVNWAIGLTEILGPKLPALLDDMARGRTHDLMASVAATADLHQGDLSWACTTASSAAGGCPTSASTTCCAKGGAPSRHSRPRCWRRRAY